MAVKKLKTPDAILKEALKVDELFKKALFYAKSQGFARFLGLSTHFQPLSTHGSGALGSQLSFRPLGGDFDGLNSEATQRHR